MYGLSKKIFVVFLWLVSSSLSALVLYAFASAILPDQGASIAWMNAAIYLFGAIGALFYSARKIPSALKFLMLAALVIVGSFLGKFLIEAFFTAPKSIVLNHFSFGVFAGIAFLFLFWAMSYLSKRFSYLFLLLDTEKDHKTPESYLSWLKSDALNDPKRLEPKQAVGFLQRFGMLLLILLFVAIAKTPSTSGLLSIFMLLYALGSLGVYFIIYQMSSLVKWKLMGYRTDETIVKNWNNLILLFLVPVIVIPLVIPWNYSIVKTTALTTYFNTQFSKLTEGLTTSYLTKNSETFYQNQSNSIEFNTGLPTATNQEAFWNVVKTVGLVIIAFLVVYTILGIIGWVLFNRYKYAKKSRLVQFLINRYYKLKNFFDILGGVFSPIGDFFARILGLKKPEEEEETKQIEKNLYSYFESIKQLPVEKQEEIRTIIREFVRLLQTSSRTITPYYFFQGPLEYTEKVIDMRPTLAIDLRKVVNVFNESRYSLHILGEELKREFQRTVDSLIITIEHDKTTAK